MFNESCWQLFRKHEHDKSDEKRAQEDIDKTRPHLWVLSRTELYPLAMGDFDNYHVQLEERH